MRRLSLIVTVFLLSIQVCAQKIGVVDTNYILSKLPQYKEAENRLNTQVSQWQSDLQRMQDEYERKREAFENEKVLLVGEQLKLREKEVVDMEANIRNTIGARFGTNGEVNQLRSNLTKPYQDQIWNTIKTVSTKNNLGIVLDKNDNNVLFLDKKYDYTDAVLSLLVKNLPAAEDKRPSTKPGVNNSVPPSRSRSAAGRSEALQKMKAERIESEKSVK